MSGGPSTLLPISSVGAFVSQKKLQKNIEDLVNDWRFPRVRIDVTEGNVETAIEMYKTQTTHDLIIIETDKLDGDFSENLEKLSEYCNENTAAIVIGPVNDVNLYRELTAMGVSDYLVHPISKEDIADVIASSLINRLGTAKSKLISVVGAKGGVGASSIAQALALGSSEICNQKTMLLDAAGGRSYLAVSMGQEPVTTLKEASRAALAEDEDNMKRMLIQIDDKLTLLGSGGEPILEEATKLEDFEEIINVLMKSYPVVIFDASGSPAAIQRALLGRSHKIYVTTTPTLAGLRSTRTLLQEIKTLRGNEDEDENLVDVVVNMKGQFSGQEISKSEAEKALEHDITHIVDFNAKLFVGAEMDGVKLSSMKDSGAVIEALLTGLSPLIGGKEISTNNEKEGFFDRLLKGKKG